MALPANGSLEETSLADVLIDVYLARFSGRVELRRDRVEKTFLFNKGIPVFTESNLASESLGIQLMDAGKISRAQYTQVVERVKSHHCKEGAALLDLRMIDPRGLFMALKEQVRARIVEAFGWARGEFRLEETNAPAETHPFRADVYRLVQEGIETHWSVDRVLADLEPHMQHYPSRTRKLARIQERLITDEAFETFVAALDGKQTLWRALQLATTPTAMAAAWVLDAAQVIEYRDVAPGDTQPVDLDIEVVVGDAVAPEVREPSRPRAAPRPESEVARAAAAETARADASTAAATGEESALEVEIRGRFENLEGLDYYQLLGVGSNAPIDEIKRAYLHAAKAYHPDALARANVARDVRDQASKVFGRIGKAYGVLSTPERRRDYDLTLAGEVGIDADRLANAETLYRKGDILLRAGNFRGAIEFLAPAVDLWPEEADYQSALGWALYKKMPSEPDRAKQHLEEAAQLAPDDAVVIFRLSVVLRATGDTVAASTLQERARKLDPKVS